MKVDRLSLEQPGKLATLLHQTNLSYDIVGRVEQFG